MRIGVDRRVSCHIAIRESLLRICLLQIIHHLLWIFKLFIIVFETFIVWIMNHLHCDESRIIANHIANQIANCINHLLCVRVFHHLYCESLVVYIVHHLSRRRWESQVSSRSKQFIYTLTRFILILSFTEKLNANAYSTVSSRDNARMHPPRSFIFDLPGVEKRPFIHFPLRLF
jgi:hypothetical protein